MRRWMLLLLVAVLSLGVPAAATAATTVPPDAVATSAPIETSPPIERDMSDCLSAMPKPGCGYEPQQAGDPGGWLQLTLFGVLVIGIAFIGWRIAAGMRKGRRDA